MPGKDQTNACLWFQDVAQVCSSPDGNMEEEECREDASANFPPIYILFSHLAAFHLHSEAL